MTAPLINKGSRDALHNPEDPMKQKKTSYLSRILTASVLSVSLLVSFHSQAAPERIISTDAGTTEIIKALELTDHLVAIDVTSPQLLPGKKLPNIGYHRNLSAEGLLSLNPDAIIGGKEMGPDHVVDRLKQSPVQLIQLPAARSEAQLIDNIRTLSEQLDQASRGQKLLSGLQKKLDQLHNQALSSEQAVFLLFMNDKLRMAGRESGGGSLIKLLGANNLADYDNYRSISAEALLTLKPSLIIIAGKEPEKAVQQLLEANPMLKHTPAGKQQKILAVDGSSLVSGGLSVSAVDEALRLSNQLNP